MTILFGLLLSIIGFYVGYTRKDRIEFSKGYRIGRADALAEMEQSEEQPSNPIGFLAEWEKFLNDCPDEDEEETEIDPTIICGESEPKYEPFSGDLKLSAETAQFLTENKQTGNSS